jgi:hypothetical protein
LGVPVLLRVCLLGVLMVLLHLVCGLLCLFSLLLLVALPTGSFINTTVWCAFDIEAHVCFQLLMFANKIARANSRSLLLFE